MKKVYLLRINGPDSSPIIAIYDNEYSAKEHLKAIEQTVERLDEAVRRLKVKFGEFNWVDHSFEDVEYVVVDQEHSNMGGYAWDEEYSIEERNLEHFFNRNR